MKKIVVIVLLLLLCLHPLTADYVPYSEDEFPAWSIKLRRAETLLFGSLPITVPVATLGYSLAVSLGAPRFSADPFYDSLSVFGVAAVLSLGIAIADYIIGEMSP